MSPSFSIKFLISFFSRHICTHFMNPIIRSCSDDGLSIYHQTFVSLEFGRESQSQEFETYYRKIYAEVVAKRRDVILV